MSSARHTRTAGVALVLLAVTASVSACGGDSGSGAELRALEQDPLGRFEPSGGRLVRTDAAGEQADGLLRKPTPATLRRYFSVPAGREDAALGAAADAARAAGWRVGRTVAGLGTTGSKRLPTGGATMSLSISSTAVGLPEGVRPPVLAVALEHSRS